MSQVLDQPASVDNAATAGSDSPNTSAAQAADESAESSTQVAASGKDAIADLDKQYKQNLLAPEDEKSEPEPEPQKQLAPEELEEKVELDPLAEQTGARTLDDLRKQFPRAQTVALEEIAKVEAEKWKLQAEVDEMGGTVGMEIAKGVMPLLLKANPGEPDADALLDHLFLTNAPLGIEASKILLNKALSEESIDPATSLPIGVATGNAIIKEHLDPAYDVDSVKKLIEFDKAGLLDHETLEKELTTYAGPTDREKELEARLKAVEDRDKAAQADKETKAQARIAEHVSRTENYVVKSAIDRIIPIAEHYGWTATKEELNSKDPAVKELAESKIAMGDMLTAWVNQFVKQQPGWTSVTHLGETERAFNGDKPTHLLASNGDPLANAVVAAFKEKVRILNKTFAKSFGASRAAQLKEKTARSSPDTSKIPPVKKPDNVPVSGNALIDAADAAYRQAVKQANAEAR